MKVVQTAQPRTPQQRHHDTACSLGRAIEHLKAALRHQTLPGGARLEVNDCLANLLDEAKKVQEMASRYSEIPW